jgi:hypothetical protein
MKYSTNRDAGSNKRLQEIIKIEKSYLNQQHLCRDWAVLTLSYPTKRKKSNKIQIEFAENIARIYNKRS